jgi:AraC-like DNA-binding protein
MGTIYWKDNMYGRAEGLLKRSLVMARETGDIKTISVCYIYLMQLKNETGDFDEAHDYMSAYYNMKDSIQQAAAASKIAELEIKYETAKKEHTIEILSRDNRIQALWSNILIGVIVALILAVYAYYVFQKRQENKDRIILNLEIDRLTSENSELSEKYRKLIQVDSKGPAQSADEKLLKKAIEIIEHNLGDPNFSVERMAREMGMSRTNMHRRIKAITAFPPSDLLRSVRLRKAAELLLQRTDSVAQISFQIGFEDQSYFSKAFKKQFGVAPSEYHKSVNAGIVE